MSRLSLLFTALTMSLCVTAPASAQTLTYAAEGTITSALPGFLPDLWTPVQVGDPFTVTFQVDTSLAPTFNQDNLGTNVQWAGSVLSYDLDINGLTATSTSLGTNGVIVREDHSIMSQGNCRDTLQIYAADSTSDIDNVAIGFETILSLPACPTAMNHGFGFPLSVDLAAFVDKRLYLDSAGSGFYSGSVNSLTIMVTGDDCADAIALPTNFADTPYAATGATTDGLAAGTNCDYGPFGDEQNHNDIWFTYTPDVGGCTYISTYDLAGYDTRLTVYSGYTCPDVPLNIIACADDEEPGAGPFEAGLDVDLTAGQTYTIRLGTYNAGTAAGSGILRVAQGPGADIHSGGQNPGAPGCEVRRIPLNYNFNGIVHAGEAGLPDDPNGFRSVSDRALDFQAGRPFDGITSKYYLIDEPGELDLVHLGNRNTVTTGNWAFDATADGDWLGTQPAWLTNVDQSGPQTTVLAAPILLFPGAGATMILQGSDGGGGLEMTLDFVSGGSQTFTAIAGDWFIGPYASVWRDDAQTTLSTLNLTENFFDLSPHVGEAVTQITFKNATNTNGAIAILAMNINTGAPTTPANDDCANAIALPSTFADTPYDPSGATTDGSDALGFCDYGTFGDELNHKDIWFTYTPDLGGCTYISTFGLAAYDTRLTVYDSTSCPDDPANIIACADEEMLPPATPFEAGLDVNLVQGQTYLIRLGTYGENSVSSTGILRIAPGPGAQINSGGANPGAPGCGTFVEVCNGDGGNQLGCTNCPCMNNAPAGTIGGCLNSAATSARLEATGDPSVSLPSGSADDLRFSIAGAPPGAFCILNSGDGLAPGGMANPCFGLNTGAQAAQFDGLRCAIMNTRRHGGRSADGNGDVGVTNNPWGGEGGPPVGIANAGPGIAAGQTRFFQVINRDDALLSCMRGLNTSQAIRVTFQP